MARPLVLASTSQYRRALLARLGVAFIVAAPEYDERTYDAEFVRLPEDEFALMLAAGKARSLRDRYPDAYILGADQIAVDPSPPRCLLHKPGTPEAAVATLMRLAGRAHRLVTGVVLLDATSGVCRTAVDVHTLTMRAFSRGEAQAYVDAFAPLDCAGAYRVEDAGILLFSRITGDDYTGIIGLPLLAVATLLREVGLLPASQA